MHLVMFSNHLQRCYALSVPDGIFGTNGRPQTSLLAARRSFLAVFFVIFEHFDGSVMQVSR